MSISLGADAARDAFRAVVGDGNVLTAEPDVSGYTTDWTGAYAAPALAVVRPGTTKEVSQVIRICHENGIAVVPQGGRTGICGGGVPVEGQDAIILSLVRMNKIRSLDTAGRSVVVEAGVILENLHHAVLDHDLVFPLVFGAKGSCTIGGNLATNAGGSNVVRYGNTRELCLGVEAVMADGSVINALTGLRKDNTGYDLKDLLIGSEGTLGLITEITLKLQGIPESISSARCSFPSVDAACQAVMMVIQYGIPVARIEMLDAMKNRSIDRDGVFEKFGVFPDRVVDVQALAGDVDPSLAMGSGMEAAMADLAPVFQQLHHASDTLKDILAEYGVSEHGHLMSPLDMVSRGGADHEIKGMLLDLADYVVARVK